jgi:hypothetical protein
MEITALDRLHANISASIDLLDVLTIHQRFFGPGCPVYPFDHE